ncbi:alpha/beta hydrolase [Ruegeria sp. R14_0]|uniref:alpha/beta hydrolase n=1 Tax=Ruegeria sp. R14_0 TaxID=2821100 RepID=UPI001ADC12D9|nr:alpha/beta hydrolase [Ruegeria sp. R14_0]MBO9447003.1 alpha/beta hydrolase [Ruegeria sp. R14_0]
MQVFWDRQFKFSEIIPDFSAALERMTEDSDAVAQRLRFTRATYGDHPRQWVEWTEGTGPQTVLPVIIHGGYWRALQAETHRFMIPAFLAAGTAVANMEYRLMPDVRLADVVADTKAGLRKLAQTFPSARFVLVGHSAGAHLALSAMSDAALAEQTLGVLSLSGVYDLAPVPLSFLQSELQLTPEDVEDFTLSPTGERPPALYINGSAETPEYLRGGALMSQPDNAGWHVIDGADHMSLTWAACDQAELLLSKLYALGNTK